MITCPYAVPSCIVRATIADNAYFLNEKVAEVALCLFETEACLAYDEADLPLELANLALKWHIHLSVDLAWDKGGDKSAQQALALFEKVKYLSPHLVVLHPPSLKNKSSLLHAFIKTWRKHSNIPVLLENISDCNLSDIKDVIIDENFKVCLDVAHALSFGHYSLLNDLELLEKIQLVHWSAPGIKDEHLSLAEFTMDELTAIMKLSVHLPKNAVHLLEIFNWEGVELSIPILDKILK